jgi:mRNA interferase RelE/StbE
VTRRLELGEKAIDQAAGILTNDPAGLRFVLDAVDHLAIDPRPGESFPVGSPHVRRLRIGRYRVMYEITDNKIVILRIARAQATD